MMALMVELGHTDGQWWALAVLVDSNGRFSTNVSADLPELGEAAAALAKLVGTDPFDPHHPPMPHALFAALDDLCDDAAEELGWATQRDQRAFVQTTFDLMLDTVSVAEMLGVRPATVHRELVRARNARAAGEVPTGDERPILAFPEPDAYRGRTPLWHRHRIEWYRDDAAHRAARRTGRPRSA